MGKQVVRSGRVYDSVTGRYLGVEGEVEQAEVVASGEAQEAETQDEAPADPSRLVASQMNKDDLYELAKREQIQGYSEMNKAELAKSLGEAGFVEDDLNG